MLNPISFLGEVIKNNWSPEEKATELTKAADGKIGARISELPITKLKAAYVSHSQNILEMRQQAKKDGRERQIIKDATPAFVITGPRHPKWNKGLCNQAMQHAHQEGMWLDGQLVKGIETRSVSASWREIGIESGMKVLSELCLASLTYALDSAESERLWVHFQRLDP